jgi:hypothetical protein
MSRSKAPTKVSEIANIVLSIGAEEPLSTWCRDAAAAASGANVIATGVKQAATTAADVRPYAIVIPDPIYQFDRAEFDALGRDLGAEVVVADAHLTRDALMRALIKASERML